MDLRDYLRILRRRTGVILLLVAVTSVSAVAWGMSRPPIYRSSALLQVIPARFDFGLTQAAEQLLRQFAIQIETPARAQEVIATLQLDITVDDFLATVTTAARPEEFLVQIDVDHPDPATSQEIANALAQNFVEEHNARALEQDRSVRVGIEILEEAESGELVWPKIEVLGIAGALFGLALGGVITFALEIMESGALRSSQDMELSEYWKVLRKWWYVILLAPLVLVVLAVLFAQIQQPIYRAEATLQVKPAVFDYNTVLTANQLLNQFALQVKTTNLAERVLGQVSLEMEPREFLKSVTVTPIPEDFLLLIEVDLPDGEMAKQVANAFATEFVDYHTQRILAIDPLERIEITTLIPADRYWQHWPRTRILALAGGLAGGLIGLVSAFVLEYIESDRLRSAAEVERVLGVPALGAIPTNPHTRRIGRT